MMSCQQLKTSAFKPVNWRKLFYMIVVSLEFFHLHILRVQLL